MAAGRAGLLALRSPRGEDFLLVLIAVLLAGLALWPLGRLGLEAFRLPGGAPLDSLLELWRARATRVALANTIEAALLSTLLATLLGTALAFLLTLTDLPARGTLAFLALLPLLVPSQVAALAWSDLLGPSSPLLDVLGLAPAAGSRNPLHSAGGVAFVMGVEHMPAAFLAVRAGLAQVPRDLVEAARIAGARPIGIVGRILLPIAWPGILVGAALAFAAALGNFGVPALLGIPARYTVLTTLIYQRLSGFGPRVLPEVAGLSAILLALAGIGLLASAGAARLGRTGTLDRSGVALRPFELGRLRDPLGSLLVLLLGLLTVVPLAALLASSVTPAIGVKLGLGNLTLAHYAPFFDPRSALRRGFVNSLALSTLAALACAAIAVPLAHLAVLRRRSLARALGFAASLPWAVPGIVFGIAVILVLLPPLPGLGVSLYGSFWILLLAYVPRFLALALQPASAAFAQLDTGLDEAARMAGAGILMRLRAILLPAVAPAALAGGLLVFLTAFGELTVSALLWSNGNETVGVMAFQLQYEGNSNAAAAVSVVTVAVVLVLAVLLGVLARHLPQGAVPWRV